VMVPAQLCDYISRRCEQTLLFQGVNLSGSARCRDILVQGYGPVDVTSIHALVSALPDGQTVGISKSQCISDEIRLFKVISIFAPRFQIFKLIRNRPKLISKTKMPN